MISLLKSLALRLPQRHVQSLKRQYFAYQIRHNRFLSEEPEYAMLGGLIKAGDWVIDVGANVGTYSRRFSQLVGPTGRVFALEPVPETFELLVANARLFPYPNVTLLNLAASDESRLVQMHVPISDNGDVRHHLAHVVDAQGEGGVFAAPIDALSIPERVALAKIDAEGHELAVLQGMRSLLDRDHPTLIVEASSKSLLSYLIDLGYECRQEHGSWNYLFSYGGGQ